MMDRIDAVLHTAYGTPIRRSEVDELETLRATLSDHQEKRLLAGLSGRIRIYPTAKGMYRAESIKVDGINEYQLSLDSPQSCECHDFVYQCLGSNGKSRHCKHGWRARVLARYNALPDKETNPRQWLLASINEDLEFISEDNKDTREGLRRLKSDIDSQISTELPIGSLMRKRARLLARSVDELSWEVSKSI